MALNFPNSPSLNDLHEENLTKWRWNGSSWIRVVTTSTAGAQGFQGAAGAQGATAAQGAQGDDGAQGAQGHQGATGSGAQGNAGAQGAQGAQGSPGNNGNDGVAALDIATGPPNSPTAGDLWWDSDDGDLHVYYNDGDSSQWVAVSQGPAGSPATATPGGSNTQLQINNSGAFGGSNLKYGSHLDGSLDFSNTAGTVHGRIACYHDTLAGPGDNALYFYGDLDAAVTWNLKVTDNAVTVSGSFSKGSGSFRIPHPLPALKDTKDLVHSFIEGPQCDNLYRGKVDLVGGTATVNLDTKSDMTTGTFVALNRDVQCFTTNETGWTNVKGSVSGNILTITAQDNTCTDTISWMVVGERQDDNIKSSSLTDANGKLIMEPNQIPSPPPPTI